MRFQLRAVLVLLCALVLPVRPAGAEELNLGLTVREGGFEPAQIETPAGARVRLEVANETGSAIEFKSFELNRERVVPAGQKVVVYLSGLEAGRYEFFDDFHQERRGVLLVR